MKGLEGVPYPLTQELQGDDWKEALQDTFKRPHPHPKPNPNPNPNPNTNTITPERGCCASAQGTPGGVGW